jgi:hypothetical protein
MISKIGIACRARLKEPRRFDQALKSPRYPLDRHQGLAFIELKTGEGLQLSFGLFFYLRLKRFFNDLLELADIFAGKFSVLDTFTIHTEHL